MKRAKKILLYFFFIFISFSFVGVKRIEAGVYSGDIVTWQERDVDDKKTQCNILGSCIEANNEIFVYVKNIKDNKDNLIKNGTKIKIGIFKGGLFKYAEVNNGRSETISFDASKVKESKQIEILVQNFGGQTIATESFDSLIQNNCDSASCNTNLETSTPYKVCDQIQQDSEEYGRCMDCFVEKNGVWTAVGCIPQDPTSAVSALVEIGLGIAGGIVLIMILVGSFMFSTSQGDPNKTKEAKEIISSAIIGLIFIIFSVTLLQFIGVEILHIPGFGEK